MDKLIPIFILISIIIIGFVMKLFELKDIVKRIDFTSKYRNKFIDFTNALFSAKSFNQQLYYELTSDVNAMQYELGADGIFAHVIDNLNGYSTRNYQLLINFLPELRDAISEMANSIIMMRCSKSAKDCDDMFIRHLGSLEEYDKSVRNNLFNPFSCFSEGIKSIISHLGAENFPRVKIGVGKKPNPEYDLAAWVLGRFPKEQEADLKSALENSTKAIRLIVAGKIDEAMNKYNS